MRKKLLFAGAFLLTATLFTSCEGLFEKCETCSVNTYEDGVLISSQQTAEYCGAELIAYKATPDVTVGTTVTKIECE